MEIRERATREPGITPGFDVIDALADKYNISVDRKKARAYVGKGIIAGQKVILAKPQTYMNLSGESIRGLTDYYKIDVEQELLVIYDDISLAPGQIRIRKKGSAGGHNGMKNIIAHLGTTGVPADQGGRGGKAQEFRPGGLCAQPFLHRGSGGRWKKDTRKQSAAAEMILAGEVDGAMNEYNRKVKPGEN